MNAQTENPAADAAQRYQRTSEPVNRVASLSALLPGRVREEPATCETHGDFVNVILCRDDGSETPGGCPHCAFANRPSAQQLHAAEMAEELKAQAPERMRKLAIASGMPEHFRTASMKDFSIDHGQHQETTLRAFHAYLKEMDQHVRDQMNVMLVGQIGTGKTKLACVAIRKAISLGFSTKYTTARDLVRAITETWGDRTVRESDALMEFTTPRVLVIDELGIQYGKGHERLILFEVLNKRKEQHLPTILAGNVTLDEMNGTWLDERAFSRVMENCLVLECLWPDYRLRRPYERK